MNTILWGQAPEKGDMGCGALRHACRTSRAFLHTCDADPAVGISPHRCMTGCTCIFPSGHLPSASSGMNTAPDKSQSPPTAIQCHAALLWRRYGYPDIRLRLRRFSGLGQALPRRKALSRHAILLAQRAERHRPSAHQLLHPSAAACQVRPHNVVPFPDIQLVQASGHVHFRLSTAPSVLHAACEGHESHFKVGACSAEPFF